MKNVLAQWFTVMALLSVAAHAAPPTGGQPSNQGGESGGGGESFAAHFSNAGKNIGRVFNTLCESKQPGLRVLCSYKDKFTNALAYAKVLPQDSLDGKDGKPRDAGPDGHGNILLNVPAYKEKLKSSAAIPGLAQVIAHEYFISAGVEKDDNYDLSSQLMGAFKTGFIDLTVIIGPPPVTTTFAWHMAGEISHNAEDRRYFCYEFNEQKQVLNDGNPVEDSYCHTPKPIAVPIKKTFYSEFKVSGNGFISCDRAADAAESDAKAACIREGFSPSLCVTVNRAVVASGSIGSYGYCKVGATIAGTKP